MSLCRVLNFFTSLVLSLMILFRSLFLYVYRAAFLYVVRPFFLSLY